MDGVINVYKPIGITSFDVVKKIMKICGTKKVGHTGTLDPLASGVLPICIGRATKLVDYIMSETKVYKAQLMLGVVTDTYDREGTVLSRNDVNLEDEKIIGAINSFIGDIYQEPPMYSAIKVNGKRLYELARKGIIVEREKRLVQIFDIKVLDINFPSVTFTVTCSKGTYIRSLCKDIGDRLGVGGTMWNLERIQTGCFKASEAVNLETLTSDNVSDYLVPMDESLKTYEILKFPCKHEKLLVNGVRINNPYIIAGISLGKLYRVYTEDGRFIGLGSRDEEGFKIIKLLV